MAHFAELDQNNIVLRVLVVDNANEADGENFLANVLCLGGRWIQTSYNNTIRKNFAGAGYRYDPVADAFISPQPYPSWLLNTTSYKWEAPVARPAQGVWEWDESIVNWKAVV